MRGSKKDCSSALVGTVFPVAAFSRTLLRVSGGKSGSEYTSLSTEDTKVFRECMYLHFTTTYRNRSAFSKPAPRARLFLNRLRRLRLIRRLHRRICDALLHDVREGLQG
jgi:hypothetical protein